MKDTKKQNNAENFFNSEIEGICPLEFVTPESEKKISDAEVVEPLEFFGCGKEYEEVQNALSEIFMKKINKNLDAVISPLFFMESNIEHVANYQIVPIQKIVYINRFGNTIKDSEKIISEIYFENGRMEEFVILTKNVKRLSIIVGDEFSEAQLDPEVPFGAKKLENAFRDATKSIPVIRSFVEHGWQKIDGMRVYVHDNLAADNLVFETGLTLPFFHCKPELVGDIFMNAYQLYTDKSAMATMLAFAFLGVLYKVFEEAGYAPKFLLFINGRTGSMKTTLAKILFIQLADDAHREMPRRFDADTPTSFERGIVLGGRDTVTVIDDYAPAKTIRQKFDNERKLESIVRMVGDRSTKSRSNTSLGDCRGEGVHGVVALTGELVGKGLSSNLRCFYCGIKREFVNVEMVSYFQNEKSLFTTLIYNFAHYLSWGWEKKVQFIRKAFPAERKSVGETIGAYRLIDSTVTLRLVCDILSDFLQEYCRISLIEVQNIIGEMKNGILGIASISESISQEESVAVQVARIIGQLMQSEKIKIIKTRPTENEISYIDGFYDSGFYYFLPQNLYEKVNRAFSSANIFMPFNQEEMVKSMYEEGIIVSSPNGFGKKTYYARIQVGKGKKIKFVKMREKIIEEIVND